MWAQGWIPQKSNGTALYWSVLTKQPGMRMDDGAYYHGARRHWVTADAVGLERIKRLQELPDLQDIYFSQSLYWQRGKRHDKSGIAVSPWCWVDLDAYNVIEGWDGLQQEERLEILTEAVMSAGVPFPSLIVSSGRGAYMLWKLKDPVWNIGKGRKKPLRLVEAVNKALATALISVGSDVQCAEGNRVLRIPGSRNSKTYSLCRVMHDSRLTYSMAELKKILPYTSDEVVKWKEKQRRKTIQFNQKRKEWQEENEKRKRKKEIFDELGDVVSFEAVRLRKPRFTRGGHALRILDDLRALARMRFEGEKVRKGWRDFYCHLAVSALASCTPEDQLLDTARSHLRDYIPHDYLAKKFVGHNSTSVKLAKEGKSYAYKGNTMALLLNVSSDEEEHLKVIVSDETRGARRQVAKAVGERARRRRNGAQERAAYEEESVSKAKPWEAKGISRATWYRREKSCAPNVHHRKRA